MPASTDQQCFETTGSLCRWVYDNTGQNADLANLTNWLLDKPMQILLVLVIALILTATAFGGLLERAGFVSVLLEALMKRVHGPRGLIITTVLASVGVNVLIAEQYLAIVLPGRMSQPAYAEQGLHPTMLSRTLEDAGTVTSPLVPWNSCGAYMAATLGVSTFAYLPYAFFNLAMPVIAITWAAMGWFIRMTEPAHGNLATPPGSEGTEA